MCNVNFKNWNFNKKIDVFFLSCRFKDEPAVVQHQIMTSCIKLFLQRPSDGHELLQKLLKIATVECENPDLRDRQPF